MNKINAYWLTFSLPVRILACAVAVLAVVVIISNIGANIERRRYEKEKQRLEEAAGNAQEETARWVGVATEAERKVETLTQELAKANQSLLDANQELQYAHSATAQTRTVYVKAKSSPVPPSYLTGDPSADSRELCARLAAAGFPCK